MADFESLPLAERNAQMRLYQMGKTDIDPRTGKTQAESQKDYEAKAAEFEASQMPEVKKGEVVNTPASDPITQAAEVAALPTVEELLANTKADLIVMAGQQGVVIPDGGDSKQAIAEAIVAARP